MERWQQLQTWLEGKELRERVILFCMSAAVIIFLLYVLLLEPVLKHSQLAGAQALAAQNQTAEIQRQLQVLQAQLEAGVFKDQEKRVDLLAQQMQTLDGELKHKIGGFIDPKVMVEVLEDILVQTPGVELISLQNQPVEPLVMASEEEQRIDTELQGLFRHGVSLKLRCDYMSAIKYLQLLESLPWQLYWSDLSYNVQEYPHAEISLEVFTVSLSEDWIGV